MMKFEYPLQWLPQQPRTKYPETSRFGDHSPSRAGDYLIDELHRLGAENCIISSNLQVRVVRGGFYARQNVTDPGVVVYFDLKGCSKAMACDKWSKVEHNLWALYLSVSAIRGLDRWGGSSFLDGLFTGFKALPSPDDILLMQKDYFEGINNLAELNKRFNELVKELHPDVGGNANDFAIMNEQHRLLKEMWKHTNTRNLNVTL